MVGSDTSITQGGTAVLACSALDTTDTLSQIAWQKQTRGQPQNSDFVTITPEDGLKVINGGGDRVKFIGNTDDKNGSLELSNITLMDEGIYTCIFSLFPSGILQKEIALHVVGVYIYVLEATFTRALQRMFSCVSFHIGCTRKPWSLKQSASW